MAVIAKMNITEPKRYPNGCFVEMSCVYDNDLSLAENEDVRFTKASPWGQATMTVEGAVPATGQMYLLFHAKEDVPNLEDCMFALLVRCHSVTDFGNSKQTEVCSVYAEDERIPLSKRISRSKSSAFNLKMSIDNPQASVQFEPMKEYWLTMYHAAQHTMDDALRLARA